MTPRGWLLLVLAFGCKDQTWKRYGDRLVECNVSLRHLGTRAPWVKHKLDGASDERLVADNVFSAAFVVHVNRELACTEKAAGCTEILRCIEQAPN